MSATNRSSNDAGSRRPSRTRNPKACRTCAAVVPALAGTMLAATCGGDPADEGIELAARVDTVSGVVHVSNTGEPPEWELAPILSIGPRLALDSDTPEAFGSVYGIAFGAGGDIFVADGLNREVRVFGPSGEHLRTFGRQGEGPGEFRNLNSLAWVGSKLLTLDFGVGRVGEFSPGGEWLGQRSEFGGIGGGGGTLRLYPVLANQAFVLTYSPARGEMIFAGHDDAGPTGDTLPILSAPEGTVSGIRCTSETMLRSYPIPFAPRIVQHPAPGGRIYSAVTDQYRIAVTHGADTVRIIERELPAEPVSDEEWEAGNEEYYAFLDENPSAACEPRRPDKPVAMPFVEDLFVAPDGRLWVEVVRAAGNRWEVYDPTGALVGAMLAPERSTAPAFGMEGRLATARRDSLGLGHVDVYQVVESR